MRAQLVVRMSIIQCKSSLIVRISRPFFSGEILSLMRWVSAEKNDQNCRSPAWLGLKWCCICDTCSEIPKRDQRMRWQHWTNDPRFVTSTNMFTDHQQTNIKHITSQYSDVGDARWIDKERDIYSDLVKMILITYFIHINRCCYIDGGVCLELQWLWFVRYFSWACHCCHQLMIIILSTHLDNIYKLGICFSSADRSGKMLVGYCKTLGWMQRVAAFFEGNQLFSVLAPFLWASLRNRHATRVR